MKQALTGRCWTFADNIDTDQIFPGKYLELTDHRQIAKHMLEGADAEFPQKYQPGDIIVAGTNFGCGSSREHAAITLKAGGVSAVIAKSFARIFYRNGVNLGIALVVCADIDKIAAEGDRLAIDLQAGTVKNLDNGLSAPCEPFTEFAMEALRHGGIIALMRAKQ